MGKQKYGILGRNINAEIPHGGGVGMQASSAWKPLKNADASQSSRMDPI
jgi:hypothetical protein